jgi:hypothetical protein
MMPPSDVVSVPAMLEAGACLEEVIEGVYAAEGDIVSTYAEAVELIESGAGVHNALELLDLFTGRIDPPASVFVPVEYSTRGRFGAGYGIAYGTFDDAGYGYGAGTYGDPDNFTGGGSYGNPEAHGSNDDQSYGSS